MSSVKIHAGDLRSGTWPLSAGSLFVGAPVERIPLTALDTLEPASTEAVERLGGKIGWGVAGGMLLGPLGLLAGLLAGGKRHQTTFVARFNDGRKMLATTDSRTFLKMRSALPLK